MGFHDMFWTDSLGIVNNWLHFWGDLGAYP